jgi:hypothetical protein
VVPRSGDVLQVGRDASVQFSEPILFRVIRVLDWPTYHGWIWLDGYELDMSGDAVDRRSIFVQRNGLRPLRPSPPAPRRPVGDSRPGRLATGRVRA